MCKIWTENSQLVNRDVPDLARSEVGSGKYWPDLHNYDIKHHSIFTVRRSALHGLCDRNSVRLSVWLSVRLSVTLVDCVHTVRPTIMISSPYFHHTPSF